jgi:hypothetical protein
MSSVSQSVIDAPPMKCVILSPSWSPLITGLEPDDGDAMAHHCVPITSTDVVLMSARHSRHGTVITLGLGHQG